MSFLALESGGGFPDELPLKELFEFPAFLFKDSALFAMNRTGMLYLLAAVITVALMLIAFAKPKIVPGRLQAAMEAIVELVRDNIIGEVIGPDGRKFLPLLTSLFLFIWVNNLFEVLPFVNFPSTGRMALPAMLAFLVWTVFILVGMKAQGGLKYFKNTVVPSGVPAPILVLIIPIEIVSTFIVRPLTLAVRLFANMMAGHILLTVVFLASNAFFIDFHDLFSPSFAAPRAWPIGIVALAGGVALVAFELLVGFLQAYIFTILTAVYIGGSLHPDH